jgi:3',5'-cyclic AMP phosphodiesterase CpdA
VPSRSTRRRSIVALLGLVLALPVPGPAAAVAPPADGPGPAIAAPQTVLIAGDIAGCTYDGDARTARLIEAIPGLVMTAGDHAYPSGTARQFRDCYDPTWGRFKARTRPVPGNHDWMVPGAAAYFDYFGTRAGPKRRGYYAFDLGAWRIYALTGSCWEVGGCGSTSPQVTWLKADLAANPHACVMAVWHEPRFSSGPHGDALYVRPLLRVLSKAGAELVVNGHDHLYERFAPATPNGVPDPARGIRQFIVGTGGKTLYAPTTAPDPHSEVRDWSTLGVLKLTLDEGAYAWEFLPVAEGGFTDRGAGICH